MISPVFAILLFFKKILHSEQQSLVSLHRYVAGQGISNVPTRESTGLFHNKPHCHEPTEWIYNI